MYWQVVDDKADHVLLWHCGTFNQPFRWRTGDQTAACRNISIRNCVRHSMGIGAGGKGQ
jgi:hypothetical protein